MDQGHQIDNQTVKFVVPHCDVSKQVKVLTILVLLKASGPWLHADACSVFMH